MSSSSENLSSMKTYRVAILGCRGRGRAAGLAYHEHPRTEVVGLCDLLSERREELGELLGVGVLFDDLDLMIRETAPDIVAIPTGTEFHHELAMRVLEHGVHIDVEKPLTTHLVKADEILKKADAQGVRVAVHHQGRSGATMRALVAAIGQGRIGDVRYLYGSGKGYYAGYGLMNIGTHLLNNMLRIAGPCRRAAASALTDGRPITPEDVIPAANGMGPIAGEKITASLEFANGMAGTLLQHRMVTVDESAYAMEIFGTEGRLFWRPGEAWKAPTPHITPGVDWEEVEPETPDGFGSVNQSDVDDYWFADEYVRALDEGREHESSGADGRHVMEIMMGIFESGARGKWVDLPQSDRRHPLEIWREESGLGPVPEMPRGYGEWLAEEDRRLGRR